MGSVHQKTKQEYGVFYNNGRTYNKAMQTLVHNFETQLHQLGYRPITAKRLPACVTEFLIHNKITDVHAISTQHIYNFKAHLSQRPSKNGIGALSEKYIWYNMYALRVFFSWLEITEQTYVNPINAIKFSYPKSAVRTPFTQDEIQLLFESTVNTAEVALLHLFYSCGLRKSEAEKLNTVDIDFSQQQLVVKAGKYSKRRVIPIPTRVVQDFETYLKHRPATHNEAFMQGRNHHRKLGESYNRDLKRIMHRAGITKVASLHYLRHSIATHLLENGVSIEFVSMFLGHKQLESTQIYTKVNTLKLNEK